MITYHRHPPLPPPKATRRVSKFPPYPYTGRILLVGNGTQVGFVDILQKVFSALNYQFFLKVQRSYFGWIAYFL